MRTSEFTAVLDKGASVHNDVISYCLVTRNQFQFDYSHNYVLEYCLDRNNVL
jgi:hypothetical protein